MQCKGEGFYRENLHKEENVQNVSENLEVSFWFFQFPSE